MKSLIGSIGLAMALAGGAANAALVSIGSGALLGDAKSSGLEACAVGAFVPACTGLPISGVTRIGTSFDAGDVADSGVSGNTLVLRNGAVVIAAPGGALDNLNPLGGFRVQIAGTITQFGFRLIDQTNFNIRLMTSSGDTLDFFEGFSLPNADRYFQSSVAISSFDVLCNNDTPCGGFGLDNLVLAGITPNSVPEPAGLALVSTALVGMAAMRRRRT